MIRREVSLQCKRFWEETSITGISNAKKAKGSFLRRVIWIIAFLVFSCITITGVFEVVSEYLDYSTATSIAIIKENTVRGDIINQNVFVTNTMIIFFFQPYRCVKRPKLFFNVSGDVSRSNRMQSEQDFMQASKRKYDKYLVWFIGNRRKELS